MLACSLARLVRCRRSCSPRGVKRARRGRHLRQAVAHALLLLLLLLGVACRRVETDGTVGSQTASSTAVAVLRPPHRKRKAHAPSPTSAPASVDAAKKAVPQNAANADDLLILASGEDCRIEVPPEGPPVADLPAGVIPKAYEEVDCPPDYDDVAWDDCSYILTRDASGCYCLHDDGPRRERAVKTKCPALERKSGT